MTADNNIARVVRITGLAKEEVCLGLTRGQLAADSYLWGVNESSWLKWTEKKGCSRRFATRTHYVRIDPATKQRTITAVPSWWRSLLSRAAQSALRFLSARSTFLYRYALAHLPIRIWNCFAFFNSTSYVSEYLNKSFPLIQTYHVIPPPPPVPSSHNITRRLVALRLIKKNLVLT